MSKLVDRAQPIPGADPSMASVVDELASSLRMAGITDPRRVAADILAALAEMPRSWPLANGDSGVGGATLSAARIAARKICRGAPFAYAVGTAQFRHLTLSVDERVLIPRPETEILAGEVLRRMNARNEGSWGVAAEIGTGSGAIALALASEGNFDSVIATDASADALAVAKFNHARLAALLRSPVEFRPGSLLAPLRGERVSVLVSNPPYVAFSEIESLPASVRDWEPPLALFSGHDGMSATAAIVRNASRILAPGGLLALEVDERRASLVADLAMGHGGYRDIAVGLDLTGRERFVFCEARR